MRSPDVLESANGQAYACAVKGSLPDTTQISYRYTYVVNLQGGRDVKAEVGDCTIAVAPGLNSMVAANLPTDATALAKFSGSADCYNFSMVDPATSGSDLALKGGHRRPAHASNLKVRMTCGSSKIQGLSACQEALTFCQTIMPGMHSSEELPLIVLHKRCAFPLDRILHNREL